MSDESRESQSGRAADAPGSGAQTRRKPTAGVEPRRAAAPATPTTSASEHAVTIEKVPFFSGLDTESLAELGAAARRRTFRAGEIVFHRDDPGQVLYVIRAGKVKIYITSQDGQEVSLAVFGPGDYFGELALLSREPRDASVTADTDMRLLILGQREFTGLLDSIPGLASKILGIMARRLRAADLKAHRV